MITLPYGGHFDEDQLIQYVLSSGRNYIIQGQQSVANKKHSKRLSLDYWLRKFAHNPDTKQAENCVINALLATGRFQVEIKLVCPESGRRCKGLRLVA